ncbi:FecR family protein [Sphingobacterium paludis]|uniref:FecR family protein n=1 Tax=Sphingobacterium paludis TaxID=1476465 RepID=A0A4R7D0K4_9SPHI|nr:FecR family protein [Sphingobacterium paludis]TDS13837.1 FecR family protein [Sphingobacterium paludis]
MIFKKLKKLLRKYEDNSASPAERKAVDIWYESFSVQNDSAPLFDTETARSAMRQRIWANLPMSTKQPSWLRRHRYVLLGLSTAALLAVVFSWNYMQRHLTPQDSKMQEANYIAAFTASTTTKERKLITLPDSSRVWLNANSTLSVDAGYGTSVRQMQLEGEAFFDVSPDPAKPFVVKTKHIKIQVLGTAFNIQAYAATEKFRVGVAHGKVAVWDHAEQELNQLTKGQVLSYDIHNGESTTQQAAVIGSWREGRVILEQASFKDLAQAIYTIYGMRLRNESRSAQKYSYNLQIRNNRSLEQTLDVVCGMHQLHYRREDNEIILY